MFIGIDLGTTNTVLYRGDIENKKLKTKLITIPNDKKGELFQLPSFIYIKDKTTIFVGAYAQEMRRTRGDLVIQGIKNSMGMRKSDPKYMEYAYHGKTWEPWELAALFLKKTAEKICRINGGKMVEHSVITVPMGFGPESNEDTLRAAKTAGFQEVTLLEEPKAALYSILHSGEVELSEFENPKNVMVYDLGGGTLDVYIAQVFWQQEKLTVTHRAHSKHTIFGGNEFDRAFADDILNRWKQQHSTNENFRKMLETLTDQEKELIGAKCYDLAEDGKKKIIRSYEESEDENLKIRINEKLQGSYEVLFEISYGEYAALFSDFLRKGCTLTELLLESREVLSQREDAVSPAALAAAGIHHEPIELIFITGGMARFSLIKKRLQELFPLARIVTDPDPDNSIAKGAVYFQYMEQSLESVVEAPPVVLSYSLGLEDAEGNFPCLIEKGASLPVEKIKKFRLKEKSNWIPIKLASGYTTDEKNFITDARPYHMDRKDYFFESPIEEDTVVDVIISIGKNQDLKLEIRAENREAKALPNPVNPVQEVILPKKRGLSSVLPMESFEAALEEWRKYTEGNAKLTISRQERIAISFIKYFTQFDSWLSEQNPSLNLLKVLRLSARFGDSQVKNLLWNYVQNKFPQIQNGEYLRYNVIHEQFIYLASQTGKEDTIAFFQNLRARGAYSAAFPQLISLCGCSQSHFDILCSYWKSDSDNETLKIEICRFLMKFTKDKRMNFSFLGVAGRVCSQKTSHIGPWDRSLYVLLRLLSSPNSDIIENLRIFLFPNEKILVPNLELILSNLSQIE